MSDTNSVALEGLITGSTVGFIAGEAAARQDTFVRPLRGCGGADARCGGAGSLWTRIDSSRLPGETRRGASRDRVRPKAKNEG